MATRPQGGTIVVWRVLWAALLASQLVYLMLLTLPGLVAVPAAPPDPQLPLVLAGAAAVIAVVSFVLPARLRAASMARVALATERRPDPSARGAFREAVPTHELADPEAMRRAALLAGFVPFVLSLALSESVSVLGLVLGFLGHEPLVWAPLIATGMLLTMARFPSEQRLVEALARAKGLSAPAL